METQFDGWCHAEVTLKADCGVAADAPVTDEIVPAVPRAPHREGGGKMPVNIDEMECFPTIPIIFRNKEFILHTLSLLSSHHTALHPPLNFENSEEMGMRRFSSAISIYCVPHWQWKRMRKLRIALRSLKGANLPNVQSPRLRDGELSRLGAFQVCPTRMAIASIFKPANDRFHRATTEEREPLRMHGRNIMWLRKEHRRASLTPS